jgi:hypothetical protein
MKSMVRASWLLSVVLLSATFAWGQNASASGTVTDATGAVIAGARVQITNLATNTTREVVTSVAGVYRVEPLAPGDYSIVVEKEGFRSVRIDKTTLTVDQHFTFNARLDVGEVDLKVEVDSGDVGQIDTETATLSNVIDHEKITELPLILRDPYQLVLLSPGVTQGDNLGGVSVNGARDRNNNYLLDGADNNDTEVPGTLSGLTAQNPDSTEEFRILTNNFAPEYGRNNGAIVDVVTRSGTNDLHGNVFYFGRWDALGARDYFNHQIDPVTGNIARKDPYVRNIYGASIGGPLVKDRTFFFLNYQGSRFITNLTNSSIVPTDAFKTGQFTYNFNGVSQPIDVTQPGMNNNATDVGLDPVVQQILSHYPSPTISNPDGVTGLLFYPSESREKDEDATLKFDQAIGKTNNLSVRYIYNWYRDPNSGHSDFLPGNLGATPAFARTQGLAFSLISTPTGTLSNELRVSDNRVNSGYSCNGSSLFDSFGFVDPTGRGADFNIPTFAGFGCQTLGDSNSQSRKTGTFLIADNLSKVLGRHTLKFGGEHRRVYSNNYSDFGSRQALSFNVYSGTGGAIVPLQNVASVDNPTIEDLAGLLLGLVNIAGQTQFFNSSGNRLIDDKLGFRQRELGFYAQDVWKVLPNLSITYGLRWDFYGVPFEQHNNLSNLFQNSSGVAPAVDPSNCGGTPPCNGFTFQTVGPGTGRQLYNDYYRNFQPRLGFAWDPFRDGRTSIRGGVGVFSDRVYGNLVSDARSNPPFQPSFANFITYFAYADTGSFAGGQLQNQTFPAQLPFSPVVLDGSLIFPDLFDPNMKPPRVITWNFGVQRQISRNFTLEANYVGNHGTRILRVVDGNQPQPSLVAANLAGGTPPEQLQFGNLFFGGPGLTSVNNAAFFDTFTDQTTGNSNYNGLQTIGNVRNYHGLQLQMAYTWSHAIDDSSDPLAPTVHNANYPRNSYDLAQERGSSGFDVRQRAVMSFVYDFNIGRGKSFLSNGFIGKVFEGWQASGVAQWQTGLGYDIYGTADTLHTNAQDRATVIGSTRRLPGTPKTMIAPPPSAFNQDLTAATTPWGIPTNVQRNTFRAPGVNNWDVSLGKTTKITERVSFQLRMESYNLFNRVRLAKPHDNVLDGTDAYGVSISQVGHSDGTTGARQMQVGAKVIF